MLCGLIFFLPVLPFLPSVSSVFFDLGRHGKIARRHICYCPPVFIYTTAFCGHNKRSSSFAFCFLLAFGCGHRNERERRRSIDQILEQNVSFFPDAECPQWRNANLLFTMWNGLASEAWMKKDSEIKMISILHLAIQLGADRHISLGSQVWRDMKHKRW